MRRRNGPAGPRGSREVAVGAYARFDRDRAARTGAPEVVLGEGKTVAHLEGIVARLARRGLGAIVSRPTRPQATALGRLAKQGIPLRELAGGRLFLLDGPIGGPAPGGTVAVLTAGTADVPVAEEAIALLEAVGVEVAVAHDVGVAGLHRLSRGLERIRKRRPRLYLVFAGREGALPTVVAGLVRAPVVGVPTSVGYGRGGRGEAALLAMLQSCAPIAVVNIDAAVPAALFALQLLAAPGPGGRSGRS